MKMLLLLLLLKSHPKAREIDRLASRDNQVFLLKNVLPKCSNTLSDGLSEIIPKGISLKRGNFIGLF